MLDLASLTIEHFNENMPGQDWENNFIKVFIFVLRIICLTQMLLVLPYICIVYVQQHMHEFENGFQKLTVLETIFCHFQRHNLMKQIADNFHAARAEVTLYAIKLYFENLRISLDCVLYKAAIS